MTWFAFKGYNSGKAIDLAGVQEKDAVVQGFHGYATEAQAEAHPNSVNILQKASVNLLIADYGEAKKEGAQPGGPNASNPLGAALQGSTGVSLASVEQFFGDLSSANLWIRVAKVIIGGALLIVGLAKLTGADKSVAVLGKAVAAAPLL